MTALFSRWLPCVTLATWSAILVTFYATGRIQALLHPLFRPYVLVAGLVMAGMAAVFALFPADAECCAESDCGHPFGRFSAGKWLTFLVLLLPITTAAFVSPEGFGKSTILNRGIDMDGSTVQRRAKPVAPLPETPAPAALLPAPATAVASLDLPLPSNDPAPAIPVAPVAAQPTAPLTDYLQRTPDGTIVAEVLDLLYAAQDNTLRKDFEGKTVQLIGQVMPDATGNTKGNRFKAVRMFMTCCAADARPVATLVEAEKPPGVPEMTWVKITGKATFPVENGRRTAVLRADRVEKSEPPEDSMLY